MLKKHQISYFILFFSITSSASLLLLSRSIFLDVLSMVLLVTLSVAIVRFDLSHPYVWFGPIYTLYSIAHPILIILGEAYDETYTKELMCLQWTGLVIFLLVISPKRYSYENIRNIRLNTFSSGYIYKFSLVFLLIFILALMTGSYSGKKDIYDSGSVLILVGFRVVLLFLIAYAIELISRIQAKNKSSLKITLITFMVTFLIFLFSGERDLVLRFLVITIFIYYIFSNQKKRKRFLIVLPFLMLILPLLRKMKYLGMGKGFTDTSSESFIASFLKSDFIAASKNLQILVSDPYSENLFNGFTFITDIIRSLKMDGLFSQYSFSVIEWFNHNYFASDRAGQGFTLIGEGYVNFGIIGVILIMLIVSYMVKTLYFFSIKYLYGFFIYVLSIPIFMYSIRADLSNILSPLFTQVFMSILIIKLVDHILKRNFDRALFKREVKISE